MAGTLTASGVGPHIFGGNVQINGNNIQDSGGTSRITLGDPLLFNASTTGLSVPAGQQGIMVSTSVFFNSPVGSDNYTAYPFNTSTNISIGNVVVITGANTVGTVVATGSVAVIGFAVSNALSGQTVWVATSGIITEAVSGAALNTIGTRVCTSNSAAGRITACATVGAVVGHTLTTVGAAGQVLAVVIGAQ